MTIQELEKANEVYKLCKLFWMRKIDVFCQNGFSTLETLNYS